MLVDSDEVSLLLQISLELFLFLQCISEVNSENNLLKQLPTKQTEGHRAGLKCEGLWAKIHCRQKQDKRCLL